VFRLFWRFLPNTTVSAKMSNDQCFHLARYVLQYLQYILVNKYFVQDKPIFMLILLKQGAEYTPAALCISLKPFSKTLVTEVDVDRSSVGVLGF
jgi:hypothetical protein